MIMGDTKFYWTEAEELKRDLYDGKNYFNSGRKYTRTYLPSKILALYSHISGQELFENFENKKIKSGYEKLTFLILQSLIYYLALFFFHQKILDFYNYNYQKCFFITGFLAIEPTIIQWHSSFWTESIFFSLQLITLALIIHKTNNRFFNFFIGIFVGLMYLQKTVAMFFIFPVIFYFIVSKKRGDLISILNLIFGFLIISCRCCLNLSVIYHLSGMDWILVIIHILPVEEISSVIVILSLTVLKIVQILKSV